MGRGNEGLSSQQIAVIAFCAVGSAAMIFFALKNPLTPDSIQVSASAPDRTMDAAQVKSSPGPASVRPGSKKVQPVLSREEIWDQVRDRFGSGLQAKYSPEGRLTEIRGGMREASLSQFSPEDSEKAIARAKEILDAVAPLLGVDTHSPLVNPVSQTGAVSAQVFFRQSYAGAVLAPAGSVTIDLGPEGQLLGLTSDYVPGISIANERKLDAEQARKFASVALPDQADKSPGIQIEGGNSVIWVQPSKPTEARHAYEFHVEGRQIVVDASNGSTLFKRDRRRF